MNTETPIKLRDLVTRVIDVCQLVADLKTHLTTAGHATDGFTSADFGVEMVESPGRVIFDVANP